MPGEVHDPHGSGLLRGGGVHPKGRRKSRKGEGWWSLKLSNTTDIRREVPDYDPDLKYTRHELFLLTEKILLDDDRDDAPDWLNANMMRDRGAHEILVASGVPDPAYVSGLYWRTHPNGRKWSTPETMRATGCGFYSGVNETTREVPDPPPPRKPIPIVMCSFPGCVNTTKGYKASGLCAGHRSQRQQGRELKPIKPQISAETKEAIKEASLTDETRASIARRLGVSVGAVSKYSAYAGYGKGRSKADKKKFTRSG
jgi:hypothetical protein